MPPDPRNRPSAKTKEEIFSGLASVEVDPVQKATLEVLLEIRDSLDSMPGNRRLKMSNHINNLQ
jgi:hypothetical protein